MIKSLFHIQLSCLLLLPLTNIFAQSSDKGNENIMLTIPEVSIVYIIGHRPSLPKPYKEKHTEPYTCYDHFSSYLNYLSIVSPGGKNKIMVSLEGKLPKHSQLFVKAHPGIAENGEPGMPVSNDFIELSSVPQEIIVDIGSCYTGDKIPYGNRLSYAWRVNKWKTKKNYPYWHNNVSISYTITAN